jgi:hypothetical protein
MNTYTMSSEELQKLIDKAVLAERNKISSDLRMWANAFPYKSEYTNGVIRAAMIIEGVK